MEYFSLLFLVAYGALILFGFAIALRLYTPSGRAPQLPRVAKSLGVSIADIADSGLGIHLPTADYLCAACKSKQACEVWLASHDSAAEAPAFCANAAYLRLARS